RWNRNAFSFHQRLTRVVSSIRFNRVAFDFWIERLCRGRHTREQSAAAARRQHTVEIRYFLDQLESASSLSRKNQVVIVRRDHHQPLAFGEIERKRFAILFLTIVKDDLRAVTTRRRNLRRRRIFRHRYQNAHARFTTRESHSLRVIAG